MAVPLFGAETEYALALVPDKRGFDREALVRQFFAEARNQLTHLPDMNSTCGMYLANSSRFYLDCGLHPELAGPECSDPRETVRYVEAGHRIIENLISSLNLKRARGAEVLCFRANVDYSGTHATWGCHESYMHRSPLERLQPQLMAFLVSRLILMGAGGFNPRSRGLEFSLGPRMSYFRRLITENSTGDRGIWHTKTEPLCSGYGRLHILCGENLCSQTSGVLKTGSTALAVALADAGFNPGDAVQLVDPLGALQTVARDVTCSERLATRDGRSLTAIEIQRVYLEQAIAHLNDGALPEWAGEVCRLWARTLDNLEAGAQGQTLDWEIKLALYANYARSLGIKWEELPVINEAIGKAATVLEEMAGSERPASLESLLRTKSRMPSALDAVEAQLESRGLTWDDVLNLFENRKKLFEVDMRFGQLGPEGIFNALDRMGVLHHRVEGVGDIEAAMTEPPASGRAHVRGEAIHRLSTNPHVQCDWQRIVDYKEGQVLDLSDPFVDHESWLPIETADPDLTWVPHELTAFLGLNSGAEESAQIGPYSRRTQAYECYERGDYAGAEELLRGCVTEGFELASTHCHLARVMVLTDREAEAREQVDLAWAARGDAYPYVEPRILFFRCAFAMLDGTDFAECIGQIKAQLSGYGSHSTWTILPMLDHLRSRLGRKNYRFLKALAEALSESGAMRALGRYAVWREARVTDSAAA